jgi:hypothetical protein
VAFAVVADEDRLTKRDIVGDAVDGIMCALGVFDAALFIVTKTVGGSSARSTRLLSSSSISPASSISKSSRLGVHIGATKRSCFGAQIKPAAFTRP